MVEVFCRLSWTDQVDGDPWRFLFTRGLIFCGDHKLPANAELKVFSSGATNLVNGPSVNRLVVHSTTNQMVDTSESPLFLLGGGLEATMGPFAKGSTPAHCIKIIFEWSQKLRSAARIFTKINAVALSAGGRDTHDNYGSVAILRKGWRIKILLDANQRIFEIAEVVASVPRTERAAAMNTIASKPTSAVFDNLLCIIYFSSIAACCLAHIVQDISGVNTRNIPESLQQFVRGDCVCVVT